MQAASESASACTGDGPACPALSRTIDASPECPSKMRSRVQTISSVIGALGATVLGGRQPLVSPEERAQREPSERQRDEQVSEVMAVDAVGTVRLGRPVQHFAVGQHVRLRKLVEAVDEQLDDEHEQEDRRDLEEPREVHAVAV